MMSTDNTEALPPLPEPFMELHREWSPHVYQAWADQMRDHARAALAQRDELLAEIDRKAEAGLCYFTLESAREFLKDIRQIVHEAQGKEYKR